MGESRRFHGSWFSLFMLFQPHVLFCPTLTLSSLFIKSVGRPSASLFFFFLCVCNLRVQHGMGLFHLNEVSSRMHLQTCIPDIQSHFFLLISILSCVFSLSLVLTASPCHRCCHCSPSCDNCFRGGGGQTLTNYKTVTKHQQNPSGHCPT